ncbi:Solute carrier family 22 member 6-A [Holothuria leucospilota]|uniref:Solute carrier family 22 member 6-A n=1 Tax=Holothuria leucospilota TaxID=206669 RepID=A0A9Q1BMA9_HOLLE|nr:Solute carrier family 22 member 6-A [Holothuria leucospilota]
MEFDQALKVTKPLGPTQFVVAFTACFLSAVSSWVNLSNVFLTEVSEFHCRRSPGLTLGESVPMEENGMSYAKCDQYVNLNLSADIEDCTNGWEYDTELFGESVTTEFDLVCDRASFPGISQSIIIAGIGAGNIIWGPLADRWGRRPTFITALILFNIAGLAIAFSSSYVMFASLRFLWAFFHLGSWLPGMILFIEYLVPEHRSTVGNLPGLFFTVGLLTLSGLAYLVQDWRWFSACLVVPTIIAIPFIW